MTHPFLRVVGDARAYTKRFKVSNGIGGSVSPFLTQEYIIRRDIDPKSDYVFVLYRDRYLSL